MPVMTHLLRQSGINPYHNRYNRDALDEIETRSEFYQYVILRVDKDRLKEIVDASKELNQKYRDGGGENENGYLSPIGIMEELINSDRILEDLFETFTYEIEQTLQDELLWNQ